MALKVISGVIVPNSGNRSVGSVKIRLDTGQLVNENDGEFREMVRIGSTELFQDEPCKQVSLRAIRFEDSNVDTPFYFDSSNPLFFSTSPISGRWKTVNSAG